MQKVLFTCVTGGVRLGVLCFNVFNSVVGVSVIVRGSVSASVSFG